MLKSSMFATLILTLSFAASGCGGEAVDSGPPRFPISGVVTLDGEPVEYGSLFFVPVDGGPGTSCMIQSGGFSAADPGAVSGAQGVNVEIFDGPPDEDGEREVKGIAVVSSTIAEGGSSDLLITLTSEDIKTEAQLDKESAILKKKERGRERGDGEDDRSEI